ncbi:MAG: helix-turn-helix transcriptional regulator [Alphaproteobacteria bacterium]
MLIAQQIRAARGLLGWSARELAGNAEVNISTVQRIERADGPVRGNASTLRRIQDAIEGAGVEFIEDGKPGVRLVKP